MRNEQRDRRRLSDFRSAWRNMTPEQRVEILEWLEAEHTVEDGAHLPLGFSLVSDRPGNRTYRTVGVATCSFPGCAREPLHSGPCSRED